MLTEINQIQQANFQVDLSPGQVLKEIRPQPGGQRNYLKLHAFEGLFGGAAGPGKSWALVIDVLGMQFKQTPLQKYAVHVPEYRGVLFRRRTTQLADLIDEAKTYYRDFGAYYLSSRKGDPGASFNFPTYYTKGGVAYRSTHGGARIFLCHMNEEKDKENHMGFEYQFVGFDEVTHFTYTQYMYLFSRCRSSIQNLYPRMRSTANPVGLGLRWVKKRFQPMIEPGVTKHFIADPFDEKNYRGVEVPKETPFALSRCFIPGRLKENKILMERDPGYESRIRAMGPKMSKALLDSDWDIMEGQFFDQWNADVHIIRSKYFLKYQYIRQFECLGGLDYGNVMTLMLIFKDWYDNVVLFDELTSVGEVRSIRVKRVKKFLKDRGLEKLQIIGDNNMWVSDAFDTASQESPAQAFLDAGINLTPVSKRSKDQLTYRLACNVAIKNALHYEVNPEGLIIKQPKFKVYERCGQFIETFPALIADEDNPEDIADDQEDHHYDGTKMPFMVIQETRLKPIDDRPQWLKDIKKEQAEMHIMTR